MKRLHRRDLLVKGGVSLAALACGTAGRAAPARSYGADHPNMLLAHVARKLNDLASKWDAERAKITTPAQIEARNRFVREKFREMLRGLPDRTPLEPIVTGGFEREDYRVENVMFQSRPNFWVTGNLYIPKGAGPFPGIISPCGHADTARMYPGYQLVYIGLAKCGFAVLAFDPVGQGERRHYWNPQTGETEHDFDPVYEHSMPGQLQLLLGENLTQYRVWDGMRAIDYLLTRPEIDKKLIGCAGHSGGGTLTQFISSLDERVQCAAVCEGGTSHRWPVRFGPGGRVGPSDVEQNIFPAAVHGVDLCDIHVAIAPRPLLAMIENYNPGFNRAADHIRERYRQLGVPEKFATEEATDPHQWSVKLRLATYDWFCRWFKNSKGPEREPEYEPEPIQKLYCTPSGSIRYAHQGDTVFSLLTKKQAALPPKRQLGRGKAELESARGQLQAEIRKVLKYRELQGPLAPRPLVTTPRKGYSIEKLEFLSEPDIYIPAWVFVPERRDAAAAPVVYVNEAGKQADGMQLQPLERMARQGRLVVAVDVRGIGDTRPGHAQSLTSPPEFNHLFSVETAIAYMAWFMDESLFAMRVQDVIRSVEYTLSRPDVRSSAVHLIGKGAGALWALYAAALDPRIASTVCERGLLSYATLAQSDRYLHTAGVFIMDVLKHFDLPQVAAAIAGRRLTIIDPVDAMKRPVEVARARAAYEFTQQAYTLAEASDGFRILSSRPEADPVDHYLGIRQS